MDNITFVIKTFYIVLLERLYYFMGRNKYECTKNLTYNLGKLNLFYVKLFQSLSTNTFLLDEKQIEYLSSYTDNAPFLESEVDTSFINSIHEVGEDNPEIAISLSSNPKPIKAGMIALVYEGHMKTGSKKRVIIKVIRKDIGERISDALDKIDFLVQFLGRVPYIRNTNVKDIIRENRSIMIEQTDFNTEVANIQQMRTNAKYVDYLEIPKVYPEYTSKNSKVIVMDYIDGQKLSEVKECDKDDYSMMLAKFGMKGILFDRFYHADLHPGNIIFVKQSDGRKKLGIIDFGIMGRMTKEEQDYFYKFFLNMSKDDNHFGAASSIIESLVEPKETLLALSKEQSDSLIQSIADITHHAFENHKNLVPSDLFAINEILRVSGLSLSRSFCKIELALAISDSVCSKLSHERSYLDNVKIAVGEIFDSSLFEC
jgi:predicted unusual protein kinase regulating ubiquinone biosynthesis (AarF/ABC1/UbiB family)